MRQGKTWYELLPITVRKIEAGREITWDDVDCGQHAILCEGHMYDTIEDVIEWQNDADYDAGNIKLEELRGAVPSDCWVFEPARGISDYLDDQAIDNIGFADMVDEAVLKLILEREQMRASEWYQPPHLTVWKCRSWQCNNYFDPEEWDSEETFAGFLKLDEGSISPRLQSGLIGMQGGKTGEN